MGTQKIRKRRGDRYDASRVATPHDLNAMFPYLMKGRNDSIAYYPMSIQVENLLKYMEDNKGTDKEITIFQAVMLSLLKVLRERPNLNRYVSGRRLYQRHNVVFSFIARRKIEEDSPETNVLVTIKPEDDRATAIAKLKGEIRVAKAGDSKDDDEMVSLFLKLPRGILRFAIKLLEWWDFYFDTPRFLRGLDPLRCSVYLANLGSVGMGAPYHHLFEWGTCSLFVCVGKIKPTVVVGEDGQPTVRRTMDLRISLDERIADGFYDAKALDLLEKYLEDPSLLEDL